MVLLVEEEGVEEFWVEEVVDGLIAVGWNGVGYQLA